MKGTLIYQHQPRIIFCNDVLLPKLSQHMNFFWGFRKRFNQMKIAYIIYLSKARV